MKIVSDGFLPFHVELVVKNGAVSSVTKALAQLKGPLRESQISAPFFEHFMQRLRSLKDVQKVVFEGPQSAALIVLRMAQGLTGAKAQMSAAVGSGPIGEAIEAHLSAWKVQLQASFIEGDSPLEFSVRDRRGTHGSLRLYPTSSSKCKGRPQLKLTDQLPDALVLTRSNKTLLSLARRTRAAKQMVSQRIRPLGRHDDPSQIKALISESHHVVFSTSGGLARQLAKTFELSPPRGWPETLDHNAKALVERIQQYKGARRLVIMLHKNQRDALFAAPDLPTASAQLGRIPDAAAKTARLQGAALALALERKERGVSHLPNTSKSLQNFAKAALATAHEGTSQRPWRYPKTFNRR